MASGNPPRRASMREGPLAALFRKTETEGLEPPPPTALPSPQERLRSAFSADSTVNSPFPSDVQRQAASSPAFRDTTSTRSATMKAE